MQDLTEETIKPVCNVPMDHTWLKEVYVFYLSLPVKTLISKMDYAKIVILATHWLIMFVSTQGNLKESKSNFHSLDHKDQFHCQDIANSILMISAKFVKKVT